MLQQLGTPGTGPEDGAGENRNIGLGFTLDVGGVFALNKQSPSRWRSVRPTIDDR